ncbi:MAG: hypothetical protein ABF542_11440, partial [Gluconobacter sp.]
TGYSLFKPKNCPNRRDLLFTPDQIPTELRVYQDYEMKAFIQSGYPHQSERDLFTWHVLPSLSYAPLSRLS